MAFSRRSKNEAAALDKDKQISASERQAEADFAVLYETYFERIYRYCRHRLGQPEEAEDVTSQIFVKAWAGWRKYQGGSEAAWLFRIAHNAVLNYRRDQHSQVSLEAGLDDGWLENLTAADSEVLEQLIELEQRQRLSQLIAALPSDQRELLALSIVGELSAKEVGQVVGKSEGAVWTSLHRIIQRLKAAYQREANG